jgi:hypothetical protein
MPCARRSSACSPRTTPPGRSATGPLALGAGSGVLEARPAPCAFARPGRRPGSRRGRHRAGADRAARHPSSGSSRSPRWSLPRCSSTRRRVSSGPAARPRPSGGPTRARGHWIVSTVDPDGAGGRPPPAGDRLVSLDGLPPIGRAGTGFSRRTLGIGQTYQLEIDRGGERLELSLPVVEGPNVLANHLTYFVACLVWCVIGLFIGWARPDSRRTAGVRRCRHDGLGFLNAVVMQRQPHLPPDARRPWLPLLLPLRHRRPDDRGVAVASHRPVRHRERALRAGPVGPGHHARPGRQRRGRAVGPASLDSRWRPRSRPTCSTPASS